MDCKYAFANYKVSLTALRQLLERPSLEGMDALGKKAIPYVRMHTYIGFCNMSVYKASYILSLAMQYVVE